MSSVDHRPPKVIRCPFTILVDSREQSPYTFESIHANADRGLAIFDVPTMCVGLPFGSGDYGLFRYPGIAIERKSKADLYGSVAAKRDNFEARLAAMSERAYAAVVVEAEISELMTAPPPFTQYRPKSLIRTIQAWSIRYRQVAWWFMPGREAGERMTFRLIERFYIDRQNELMGKLVGPS